MQSEEKFSLPARQYIVPHQHKYKVGERVINTNKIDWNTSEGDEGIIISLLPFGSIAPAYDIKYHIDGKIVATSERSLQKIEEPDA